MHRLEIEMRKPLSTVKPNEKAFNRIFIDSYGCIEITLDMVYSK